MHHHVSVIIVQQESHHDHWSVMPSLGIVKGTSSRRGKADQATAGLSSTANGAQAQIVRRSLARSQVALGSKKSIGDRHLGNALSHVAAMQQHQHTCKPACAVSPGARCCQDLNMLEGQPECWPLDVGNTTPAHHAGWGQAWQSCPRQRPCNRTSLTPCHGKNKVVARAVRQLYRAQFSSDASLRQGQAVSS